MKKTVKFKRLTSRVMANIAFFSRFQFFSFRCQFFPILALHRPPSNLKSRSLLSACGVLAFP